MLLSKNLPFQKNNENWNQSGARFEPRILPQFAPEGSFFRLGAQRPQRKAQGRQRTSKKNKKTANFFLEQVNSSIAMHNASTQFADGGEFGFGGEIGISTNKMPPRGPVGINQLTSYKYIVEGKGTIRL